MAKSGKASIGNIFVWILLGLLIVGLAGFGATSFGSGNPTIATVGQRDVDLNRYFRAAQQTLNNLRGQGMEITASSSEGQQVLEQVRGALLRDAAVESEAMTLGISVGDDIVAEQVRATGSFIGPDGQFDRAAYEATLRRAGMTVAGFENDLRLETARNVLRQAVTVGIGLPPSYMDTLLDHFGERRDVRLVRFTAAALDTPVAEPDTAQARTHYEANPDDFTLPARKAITYAWLTPDMLMDRVEIAQEDLRALYEERAEEFTQPERRLVERLVFPDTAAAQAALQRLTAGETTFDALVADRGLTLEDVDLGEVSAQDLGDAGADVFALDTLGVAGPAPTGLGPALFRVYAILDPVDVAFEDAVPALRNELALDRARRVIDAQVGDLEDLLASGATLEELARETDMELGRIDWWPGVTDGIAGYDGFRRAAERVQQDDFPQTETLEDGGIFALRLDAVQEPSLQPFEEVREEAAAGWIAARAEDRLREMAQGAAAQLEVGATLEASGQPVETYTDLTRDAGLPGIPAALVAAVFEMEPGAAQVVAGPDAAFVVVLDTVREADPADPQIARIRQILGQQLNQSLASDINTLYSRALTLEAGITLDNAAINAVHAELP